VTVVFAVVSGVVLEETESVVGLALAVTSDARATLTAQVAVAICP
jgi:hypothetical protein